MKPLADAHGSVIPSPDREGVVEAVVVEELPSLLYRLELGNKSAVLAHGAGSATGRNWVRLLPGDRVEVELGTDDPARGRILRKIK